ncbi:hypothetical protein EV361DRAFT_74640 [Lentinula raphanica]|uniref:DUF6699 domain-containing protein n=1 Tax=Lentinula raphanica TaxID=153919 RepID=A0AA38PIH1_9AGAR|nr:hypothetical protein F5878DRAFT_604634 [Lentinula raphanica]KAJ3973275.1 hypothetical protein EV361DRAFT_74640 [Lentinula raphanica]
MPGKTVRFQTPSPSEIDGSASPGPIPYLTLPAVDCQLHPVLMHNRSSSRSISWDMSYPIQYARLNPAWDQSNWNAPATNPNVTHMVVIFGAWRIRIFPRPGSPIPYVTVLDVLHGIYRYLRSSSSSRDFESLSPDKKMRVTEAYHRRWQRCQPGEQEMERQKGVKQIDFLAESKSFWGLSPTKELGTWQLQVLRS